MPHIWVEYSANLDDDVVIDKLLDSVHEAAIATGVFPIGGARTRAVRVEQYRIADGHRDNGFVHVVLRIGHGRDAATKKAATEAVFAAVCAFLRPVYDRRPLGISLEMQELDPVLNLKLNNLHEYVAQRRKQGVSA
jgi:5-carboxymethyl-2-hydroxymuconate isomerase